MKALKENRGKDPVSFLLPEKIYRISEKATLAEALKKMNQLEVTYLLVCRDQTPIGVIGNADIIRAYRDVC
ncbi:CBS domain-containing protein [Paludifilum halophilum]|uniref:CBS domain-containing protein n=1 Tax=Paludifilum halophilum TaxID=1642702 RepID=UPI00146D89DD|nr:CBS domain-containing protein [Paludifilum halophilum]